MWQKTFLLEEMKMNNKTRLNINIPINLMKEIEAYAKDKNINKTSAICILLSNSLKNDKKNDK